MEGALVLDVQNVSGIDRGPVVDGCEVAARWV